MIYAFLHWLCRFSDPLQMVVLMDPCEDTENHLRANRSREKTYMFDVAFDQQAQQVSSPSLFIQW